MQHKLLPIVLLGVLSSSALAETNRLEELIVTAELRNTSVLALPASVSVIDAETLAQRNVINLEDALNLAPNVNFAQGASRGRFIQIRGIGERSEFVDPVSYSVGVLVDGIDVTGVVGSGASLDLQQIEVLRGPQGTIYGANALAGLINMVSAKPSDELSGQLSATVAEYDTRTLKGTLNLPLGDNTGLRISAQQHSSNGYVDNLFLQRDDTNNIDESSVKMVFNTTPSEGFTLGATVIYDDIDNGYDAFSLDNNRNTYSDEPGHDRQESIAASLRGQLILSDSLLVEASLSHLDANIEYGYDEDWAHDGICDNTACDSALIGYDLFYSSFDNFQRDNQNTSFDVRLMSQNNDDVSWLMGLYAREQSVDLSRIYTYDTPFNSMNDTLNNAIYGQAEFALSDALTLSTGLRFEQRNSDYKDNRNVSFDIDEDLWGGKIALSYQLSDSSTAYALVSRGYKSGGFNTDGSLIAQRRVFDTEFQWNYELGVKGSSDDGRLSAEVSVFYQVRDDIQSKQSIVASQATGVEGDPCPCSFTGFVANAADGISSGLEAQTRYDISESLSLFASAGWLQAEFGTFLNNSHVDYNEVTQTPFNLKGREVAHAPKFQYSIGARYLLSEALSVQIDVEGKDRFYFSDRHNEQTDSFNLVNAALRYAQDSWEVVVWGKNLTDEDYQTRGFGSFGNDPRKLYVTEAYHQFGAPRVVGLSATVKF